MVTQIDPVKDYIEACTKAGVVHTPPEGVTMAAAFGQLLGEFMVIGSRYRARLRAEAERREANAHCSDRPCTECGSREEDRQS